MMRSGAIARFGGIEARGDEFAGPGWYFTDLLGWTDPPEVVRERVKRLSGHGTFMLPANLDERVVTLPGFLVAKSHSDLEVESARLRGLITQSIWFTIEDTLGSLRAKGTVTAASFTNHGFAPEGRWTVEVTCEDPRKYGAARDFPSGTPAINTGNLPATPLLKVGAGTGGYTITGPGGRIITVATAPTAAHTIDLRRGGLYTAAGVRQQGAITVYQPWDIPPNLTGTSASITGARTLHQRIAPTYV